MKNLSTRLVTSIVSLLLVLIFNTNTAYAQNKVVVIPMTDDTQPLGNVVTVATSNGNFTSPLTALASITSANASNRYLVIIAPGVYDLGEQQLVMKEYVDIRGSGQNSTKIISSFNSSVFEGQVQGADNASLSDLTIESSVAVDEHAAIIVNDGTSPTLSNLTTTASSGTAQYGIYNNASSATISGMLITLSDSTGNAYGVYNNNNSSVAIVDTIITLTGSGSSSQGIYNDNSSATINEATIIVSDSGSSAYGISNDSSVSILHNTVIRMSDGGGSTYGLRNFSSDTSLIDSSITVLNGSSSDYGVVVFNDTSSSIIQNCTINAPIYSVFSNASSSFIIGSNLIGSVNASINPTCTASFVGDEAIDENCEL